MKNNDIHFADASFETFTATLKKLDNPSELSHMDYILMHEYYTDKLRQKEKQKKATETQTVAKESPRAANDLNKTDGKKDQSAQDQNPDEDPEKLTYEVK